MGKAVDFLESRHFFYSCLLLFSIEKQSVTNEVCKRWLLESNFLPTGDFSLTLHFILSKFYTFLFPVRYISW